MADEEENVEATEGAGDEAASESAESTQEAAGAGEAAAPEPAAEAEPEPKPAAEAEPEPAAKAEPEPAAKAEPDPEADLPHKERQRLRRSRKPHESRPQRSGEERQAEREARRKKLAEQRRKRRAGAKSGASKAKGEGTPPVAEQANTPKVRQGIVVSDGAEKTITVRVDIARRHRVYEKIVRKSRTLHAHDEQNEASVGDVVRLVETRPISKTKRWRLEQVLEKAQ